VFYESAPAVGPLGQNPSELLKAQSYTPLKRFTFEQRTVTCNMPFFQWGLGPGQQMVTDAGGCDPNILDGSGNWNGPTGCQTYPLPLQRSGGGQVLDSVTTRQSGATLLPLSFTVKIQRAIRNNDGIRPYFAIFDATSAATAGLFGVPQSARLLGAGPAQLATSVALMNVFLNGEPCNDCSVWGFEDPIAPVVLNTPLHQLAFLYWDCQVSFSTNPSTYENYVGVPCPAAVDLAVASGDIAQTKVFYGDVEVLIDDLRVYQDGSVLEIVNSPFIATLAGVSSQ